VRAFEGAPVRGVVATALADAHAALDWQKDAQGGALSLPWPAQSAELSVVQNGTGRPWANVLASAAIPLQEPLAAGYRIVKQIQAVEPRPDGVLRPGDALHVRIEIDAQADMPWVVLDDPVPAGSSHLRGTPAGTAPAATPSGDAQDSGLTPTFVERSFQSFKAYFERLPAGKTTVEYTIRVNQAGRFVLPPTRVAALYAPETFGEIPNPPVEVAR
jgi:uncharacterized protein YfaS (alpha-2-macroglobulin family)